MAAQRTDDPRGAHRLSPRGLSLTGRHTTADRKDFPLSRQASQEALEAALSQLELSTSRTEQALDAALAEEMAGLMKEHPPHHADLRQSMPLLKTSSVDLIRSEHDER